MWLATCYVLKILKLIISFFHQESHQITILDYCMKKKHFYCVWVTTSSFLNLCFSSLECLDYILAVGLRRTLLSERVVHCHWNREYEGKYAKILACTQFPKHMLWTKSYWSEPMISPSIKTL